MVIVQAASHSKPWTSIRSRINSATETAGWVSLSWIATLSERFVRSSFSLRCRLMMSCSDAEEKKYSWRSLSSWPAWWESAGYSTRVIASALLDSTSAPMWSPELKASSRIGSSDCALQRRKVFTWLPRQPTIGVSKATASTRSAGRQTCRTGLPGSCIAETLPPKPIS